MDTVLRFSGGSKRDPAIDEWLNRTDQRSALARTWFKKMRACGEDVMELMHDGCPTACVDDAPFGYVNVFSTHTNVGFFYGAHLDDSSNLLEGSGKNMRHVKLRAGQPCNTAALEHLIDAAYLDLKLRLRAARSGD